MNIVSAIDPADLNERTDAIAVLDPGRSIYERLVRGFWTEGIKVYRAGPGPARRSGTPLLVMVLDGDPDWAKIATACATQPTLLIATDPSTEDVLRAIDLDARGYLPATISDRALVDAIRGIRAGEVAFSRAALGAWLRRQAGAQSGGANARLTPRQRQVVALIARGACEKEIASALGIATATAQKHVAHLLARLGAPNRAAAVALTTGLPQALTTRSP